MNRPLPSRALLGRPLLLAAALCACVPAARAGGEDKPKDPPSRSGPSQPQPGAREPGKDQPHPDGPKKSKWGVDSDEKDPSKALKPSDPAKKGEVAALKDLLRQAQEKKLKGVPEGWDPDKDEFLKKLLEGSGEKTAVVRDGSLMGIRVEREGKSFIYSPGAAYAVLGDAPAGGAGPEVLRLQDGALELRSWDSLGGGTGEGIRRDLARNGERLKGAIKDPEAGQRWLYDLSRRREGDGVPIGGTAPPSSPRPGTGGPAARPEAVPTGGIEIANAYQSKPPDKLKQGQCYWDGKTLMLAKAVDGAGKVAETRAVGYMARLQDIEASLQGRVVFWHGGAAPGADGLHDSADTAWALFSVDRGQDTSRGQLMGYYSSLDLRNAAGGYSTDKTQDGVRLQLWTALKSEGVNKFSGGRVESLFDGKAQPLLLFRDGTSFDSGRTSLRNLVGLDGKRYVDGRLDGKVLVFLAGFAPPPPSGGPPRPAPEGDGDFGTIRLGRGGLNDLLLNPRRPKAPPAGPGPGASPDAGPHAGSSPLARLRSTELPRRRGGVSERVYGATGKDIIEHAAQPSTGHRDPFTGRPTPTTDVHESYHRLASDFANAAGPGHTGAYLGDGKGLALKQPGNLTLGRAGQYVPQPLRQGRFDLYFGQQRQYFEDRPLYPLDEWGAYGSNAASALELARAGDYGGSGSDEMAGAFEFTVYALSIGRAVKENDPGYFQRETQFRDYLQWNAERTMQTFRAGRDIPLFNSAAPGSDWNQERAWRTLRESNDPGVQSLRRFAIETYGAEWTRRILGFSAVRYEPQS